MLSEEVQALLDLIGLRAILVDHLGRDAWLLQSAGIVLIEAELEPDRVTAVVDEVLALGVHGLCQSV